jgi:ADP-heptose:LPS heptosyltransferase
LFSLQKPAELNAAANSVSNGHFVDLAPELTDFAETAAAMKCLDLVISCDSAPVHLAGALGVPVWVALPYVPDWRWLLDRDDSPWYPSARLFRQQQRGSWPEVFSCMATALAEMVAGRQ